MEIVSICGIDFSNDRGDASSIRLSFIHKGLRERGVRLKVYSFCQDHRGVSDCDAEKYLFRREPKGNRIKTALKGLQQSVYLFKILLTLPKGSKLFVAGLPANLILSVVLYKLLNKRVDLIVMINEFLVFHNRPTKRIVRFITRLTFYFTKVLIKVSDIIVVISNTHKDYYRKLSSAETKIVVIHMLLDYSNITSKSERSGTDSFRICYAGALSRSNGVEVLIRAMKGLNNSILSIYGPSTVEFNRDMLRLIDDLKLDDRIFIFEPVSNNKIQGILSVQDLLVIPKINDERAKGYIPSKLGDFLHSETPVLCAKVGDIGKFIKDGVNGFLVHETTPDSLRCKIRDIKSLDTSRLKDIGKAGKLLTKSFHYLEQVDVILDGIKEYEKKR